MPEVDTAYIVGVIREKERGLLEHDEYTRIMEAPSGEEAVRALVDTPYGIHIEQQASVFSAVTSHLEAEMSWLQEHVQDKDVILFLTARYDGLHIARALVKHKAGEARTGRVSSPSGISHEALSSTIWDNEGFENIPEVWREFVREERTNAQADSWSNTELLTRTGQKVVGVMEQLAHTGLMEKIALHTRQHLTTDEDIRAGADDLLHNDAAAYEKNWDEELLKLIRGMRSEPTGYDPIIAYWYAKEVEASSLRLILAAKLGGFSPKQLEPLQRSLYLETL